MKRTILNLACCMIISMSFAQTTYIFDEVGEISPNPFVTEVNGTSMELYNNTLKWIKLNYNYPDEVIASKIEGEFIRISGTEEVRGTDDMVYTIEIDFKDNRYRTTLSKTNHADEKNGKTIVNSIELLTPDPKYGKSQKIIDLHKEIYQPWLNETLNILNRFNLSLFNYLSGKTDKNDGW